MKKKGMVLIVTTSVFACLLLCTPALADYNFDGFPVVTRTNGTVNGGVFIDGVGWASTTTLTGNFNVPEGEVKWARLYAGIWGGYPTHTGWVNVTFNGIYDENGLGPIHLEGEDDTNPNVWCSGCGKYWMWYNVTNLTNAGQTNIATASKIKGSIDGRIYGIVLVVVYEGGDNPKNIQYWVNDGSDAVHYAYDPHPKKNEGTTYFNGTVEIANVTKANLTMVHLTGYSPPCSNCLKFNGHELDTSMVESNDFELNSWDVTGYVNASGNNAWYSRGEDNYVNVANTILVVEREAVEKPDLDTGSPANPYPSIFGTHNGTITPNYDITVSRMYTYPCTGTGGHSEYIEIWNATEWSVNASWNGYTGDWHNISFGEPFTLEADKSYNYTIRTGSYPQIIHAKEFNATGGKITCVEFIDVNGKRYNNRIPAIKLFL